MILHVLLATRGPMLGGDAMDCPPVSVAARGELACMHHAGRSGADRLVKLSNRMLLNEDPKRRIDH
jgi:hypothetical protein